MPPPPPAFSNSISQQKQLDSLETYTHTHAYVHTGFIMHVKKVHRFTVATQISGL